MSVVLESTTEGLLGILSRSGDKKNHLQNNPNTNRRLPAEPLQVPWSPPTHKPTQHGQQLKSKKPLYFQPDPFSLPSPQSKPKNCKQRTAHAQTIQEEEPSHPKPHREGEGTDYGPKTIEHIVNNIINDVILVKENTKCIKIETLLKITTVKHSFLFQKHVDVDNKVNSNNNNGQASTTIDPPDPVSVVNLSDHQLTISEKTLLQKGLNFCPSPGEPNLGTAR